MPFALVDHTSKSNVCIDDWLKQRPCHPGFTYILGLYSLRIEFKVLAVQFTCLFILLLLMNVFLKPVSTVRFYNKIHIILYKMNK